MDSFHRWFEKLVDLEIEFQSQLQGNLSNNTFTCTIICGAIAGIVAKTVVAPAERVKLTFQVSTEKFSYTSAYYRAKEIISTGGVLSLWRGHLTTIVRVAPYSGLSYASHDLAENFFKDVFKTTSLPVQYKFLAGSIGGAVGTVCTYPLDVLRIRLALVPGLTWSRALAQGGLTHGLAPTLLGIVPYSGTSWCAKQVLTQDVWPWLTKRKPTTPELLVLNAFAGLCGQFVTYPLDIIRRRMQMHSSFLVGARNMKIGDRPAAIGSSLYEFYKTEGMRGLFKGYSLNIVKGPITLSLSFTVYDLLSGWCSNQVTQ